MTGDDIVALSKKHTISEWAAQGAVDPIPVARAEGVYFWTPEGKRFIDFNSQLMCVNIGHGEPRVIAAIQRQAEAAVLCHAVRHDHGAARAAGREAGGDYTRRHRRIFLHERRRRSQRERDSRSRAPIPAARRFLPATVRTMAAPRLRLRRPASRRRWTQPPMPGFVHVLDPYHGIQRGWDTAEEALRHVEEVIQLEGPQTIAAFILESVTGTNGVLVPPDGYMQGVPGALRQIRHPDDRRRGHERVRPDRKVVRHRALGRRAGSDHHGERADERLCSAWGGRHAAGNRRHVQGQTVPRRADLQQPSSGMRGGARHSRGDGAGRPGRSRTVAWAC